MRKIIIVSLIISLLLIQTVFFDNAKATLTTYSFGFEGTVAGTSITAGLPVGSENIITSDKVGAETTSFATSSSSSRTGTRNFYIDYVNGWWNLTYDANDYLTNFSFWYYHSYTNAIYFTFYNSEIGISQPIIKIAVNDAFDGKCVYYNEVGTKVNIANVHYTAWVYISFNIDNISGDVSYFYDATHKDGVARNPELIADGTRIDSIYIQANTDDFRIDDVSWILSDNFTASSYTQEFCNGIPQYELTSSYLTGQRFLESRYTDWTGLGITGTLTDVSLPISDTQWGGVSDELSDYKLRVNGIYFGEADNISDWDDYYSCYWITWDTYSIEIVNDFPVFSFWCDSDINGFGYYWQGVCNWACALYPFKYHNETTQWQNSIFDGTFYEDSDCDFDLAYCFTVESFDYGEPEPPNNPDEFIQSKLYFNFYDAKTGVKLQMIELSKALTYASLPYFPYENSYAELMLTLTAMSDGGDETHIYMPVEQEPPYLYSYLSSQPVVYSDVTIAPYGNNTIDFMGGSLGNIAGQVNGENVLWNRYTVVQEVQPFGDYDIYLIRYGEDNWTEPLPDPVPWENEYGDFFIEFYDENPDKTVECYYRLGGKQPILIYQVNDTLFGTYANGYLWEMTDSTGKKLQEGQIIFSSGEKNGFIPVPYVFTKEGYYQIHLYNMTVGSLKNEEVYRGEDVYVCKKTSGGGGGGTGTTPVDFIFINLGGSALGSIVGMIITIFSLLIPFMVARGMNINGIPMFVYAITGGMGIAISSILGLFPAWLPFFIIALGIIIAVIVYIYRGGSGGE